MIYKFNELDSTNKYCLENCDSLSELDVVYALHQTNGRGRLGRSWFDDDSICMSIVLKDNLNYDLGLISFVAAAAVYNVVCNYTRNVSIKWPNDILVDHKKICGILCQSTYLDSKAKCIVVGIGLNTNNEQFSEEIKNKATSLYLLNKYKYDNEELINKILKEFEVLYSKFLKGDNEYLAICRGNNYLLNKEIEFIYKQNELSGIVVGINYRCELLVRVDNEEISLNTGEVLLKNSYFFE